jgi:predicted DsbA family dithiol-disulfide isomerase
MTQKLRIDFVSDVSCPWCIIGLKALEQALDRVADSVEAELHFQPFELNPAMVPEGQDINEHLAQKYGATPEQSARTREMIRERGAELGFNFELGARSRIYNTFDAHRLLHWAGLQGRQLELKHALFTAYFTLGQNPGSHEVLLGAAGEIGLNVGEAQAVLENGSYAEEVRELEHFFQSQGINSVPAVIINQRHLISGGQPVEVFENALRQIAAQAG